MSILHQLTGIKAKSAKRLGRGIGSGKGGHTVGRGNKGMRARKSGEAPLWFEGGQLPLVKRLPMQRGKARFVSLTPVAEVSLSQLQKISAEVVTLETLKLAAVVDRHYQHAKIIANGKLDRAVTVQGVPVSTAAKQAIEKAGGKVITNA